MAESTSGLSPIGGDKYHSALAPRQSFWKNWLMGGPARAKGERSHTISPATQGQGRSELAPPIPQDQAEKHPPITPRLSTEATRSSFLNNCSAVTHHSVHTALCHARLALPPCYSPTALTDPFWRNNSAGRDSQPRESKFMQKTWHEQNCTSAVDFVVTNACHDKEEHHKDAAGHVFSTASERLPELLFFF